MVKVTILDTDSVSNGDNLGKMDRFVRRLEVFTDLFDVIGHETKNIQENCLFQLSTFIDVFF